MIHCRPSTASPPRPQPINLILVVTSTNNNRLSVTIAKNKFITYFKEYPPSSSSYSDLAPSSRDIAKTSSSADDIFTSGSFHESPTAAAAAALVKRSRPRRALTVLLARFPSYFEMLQSDHEPPTPTNPTKYPFRSRVHAVIPRGLSPHRLYCRRHGGAWPSFDHASFR